MSSTYPQHEFKPDASLPMREQAAAYVQSLQRHICAALESVENGPSPSDSASGSQVKFVPDPHIRPNNTGFGITSTLRGGKHIEKAGVAVSIVVGSLGPAAVQQMKANHKEIKYDPASGESLPFFVAGISLIVHPCNPMAPTVHMNYRYFELCESAPMDTTGSESAEFKVPKATGKRTTWWFGGGCDLTPSYVFPEDAKHFHRTIKDVCDAHCTGFYDPFKAWCDEYFYIPHRQEGRGLGGIFFDDLSAHAHPRLPSEANGHSETATRATTPEGLFEFMRACGNAFLPSYLPILQRRVDMPFTDEERRWQLVRRGRYVEFNLMYDRGTKFGLMAPGARIESILVSLPETACWEYCTDMGKEGTREGELVALLKTPRAWV
ncbi:coproporphyrinogen III oxidase [Auriculariales sp. MPI-PUGE-AT-0066]|nr:coproporphyrinogen III oxidase [Auriculariales sp. MPI-PUGE-AT-0066]